MDKTIRFDHVRGTVTVADGPPLPLPREARDGLAAFLYARTLPLAAGYEASFPVVEGGRQLAVILRVTGQELVTVAGRTTEAWRIEARIESRSERRPMSATLLVTADARRVPVDMRIDAGFGSFRVELTDYSAR